MNPLMKSEDSSSVESQRSAPGAGEQRDSMPSRKDDVQGLPARAEQARELDQVRKVEQASVTEQAAAVEQGRLSQTSSTGGDRLPKIINFDVLARCGDEIWIENNGQIYRLRRTRQGKLILTK